jgi:hypothetical protein
VAQHHHLTAVVISPSGKSAVAHDFACPAPFAKIFPFAPDPNQFTDSRRPVPNRGAFRDRHGRRRRDAVDAGGAKDEGAVADGEVVWF